MCSTHHRALPAPIVQLRALLVSAARPPPVPDEVGVRLSAVWGPNSCFQTAYPPLPTACQLLPRAPYSTNRVEMLVPRAPEHLSGKGRKLKGILFFFILKSLGPWDRLGFYPHSLEMLWDGKSQFSNGITHSNTEKILTHYSFPPLFFPVQGTCWEKEIW